MARFGHEAQQSDTVLLLEDMERHDTIPFLEPQPFRGNLGNPSTKALSVQLLTPFVSIL